MRLGSFGRQHTALPLDTLPSICSSSSSLWRPRTASSRSARSSHCMITYPASALGAVEATAAVQHACGLAGQRRGNSTAMVTSYSNMDAASVGDGLWTTDEAGDVQVEVQTIDTEQEDAQQLQQQQYHRHRHRHRVGPAAEQAQQQLPDQARWQPVVHPVEYVQLLQQAALVQSWSGALRLLQQRHHLHQAPIGLLWWQLRPRLQARQKAAAAAAHVTAVYDTSNDGIPRQSPGHCGSTADSTSSRLPQQRVQQVLHQLVELTKQHVDSLSPQSLAYTLQGLAAAVAAGEVDLDQQGQQQQQPAAGWRSSSAGSNTAAPVLSLDFVQHLRGRLLAVADRCTPQQLARCLSGGKQLGWRLSSSGASTSNDTFSMCCWSIVEAACSSRVLQGLCPPQLLRQRQRPEHSQTCCSSSEATELLAALAGLMVAGQDMHVAWQPQQQQHAANTGSSWQAQHPGVREAVANMMALACQPSVAAAAGTTTLGQGTTYTYNPNHATASARASGTASDMCSSSPANQQLAGTSAMSILQSAAALGVQPIPWELEQLVEQIEPCLGSMAAQQLLQVLQALLQLRVEPWETWLTAWYSNVESSVHQLDPQQLLELLLLLPRIKTVQPSQQLLHSLAKLTAVHCSRYSWQQLVVLPGVLAALDYRPPPYWLKDYAAATQAYLQPHLQQQQGVLQQHLPMGSAQDNLQLGERSQQDAVKLRHCVDMLVGVSRLGPSVPPASWLAAVEDKMVALLEMPQASVGNSVKITGAGVSAQILNTFACMQHYPNKRLLQLLGMAASSSSSSSRCDSSAGCDSNSHCTTHHVRADSPPQQPPPPQQQQQDEKDEDLYSWDLGLGCQLSEQLWPAHLGVPNNSMQFLIEKGWQLQRVCTTRGSRRLAAWGVCMQQDRPLLAAL